MLGPRKRRFPADMKKKLIYLLAPLLLIPALACGGDDNGDKQSDQGAEASPTRAAGTTPQAGGAQNELASVAQNLKNVKSFRATMTIEAQGQPKQEGTMEYVSPDRYHLSIAGLDLISIGTDAYIKIGSTWTKQPGAGAGALFDASDITDAFSSFESASGVTKGGTETVNGQRCQTYGFNVAGANTEICVANNLPVRMLWSDPTAGKVTIIFSNVNGNIEIKAPI